MNIQPIGIGDTRFKEFRKSTVLNICRSLAMPAHIVDPSKRTPRQHLIARINADPSDMESRWVFHDLLCEEGDQFAVGWRRLNEHERIPTMDVWSMNAGKKRLWWWSHSGNSSLGEIVFKLVDDKAEVIIYFYSPFGALQAAAEVLSDESIPLLGEGS